MMVSFLVKLQDEPETSQLRLEATFSDLKLTFLCMEQ